MDHSARQRSKSQVDFQKLENYSNRMSSSMLGTLSSSLIKPFHFNREREKQRFELSTLNDKFADYVEKVRYLESYNKKIEMDTNILTEKQHTSYQKIQSVFEKEVAKLKETAEKLLKEKPTTISVPQISKFAYKECLTDNLKDRDTSNYETEKIEKQLSSVEGDIQMFNRRITHQDHEHKKWRHFISHIQHIVLQAKNEIHNEIVTRATCEKTATQLRIDMSKLREQQRQRVSDLKKTSYILSSSSTNDRALTFKSELSSAIRSIRDDYEKQSDSLRNELYQKFKQSYDDIIRQTPELGSLLLSEREQNHIKQQEDYVRKEIQQVRSDTDSLKQKHQDMKLRIRELQIKLEMITDENKRIQQAQENLLDQWRLKHEKVTKDYDDVVIKQSSLENEISTYRNLLEGSLKPVIDHIANEYHLMPDRRLQIEQPYSKLNRKTLSKSVDALPTILQPTDTNDNNSYVSVMTININNNLIPKWQGSSATTTTTTTTQNSVGTRKSIADFYLKASDVNQQIREPRQPLYNHSSTCIRAPIVIETRRKK